MVRVRIEYDKDVHRVISDLSTLLARLRRSYGGDMAWAHIRGEADISKGMKNDKAYRGIFILNVKTLEEANLSPETDPVIKEKLLEADVYQCYGSASLLLYLDSSKQI
jgi:hypothetical protein